METQAQGRKFDEGKLRWSLLPKGTVREVVRVLAFGAQKYAPDNWQHVEDPIRRYYDALERHRDAWWDEGEQIDPETGIHHLAHLACNALFLLWFEMHGVPAPKGETHE